MEYQVPANPRHQNVIRLEDMWWVDDAWDEATLDWLIGVTKERGDWFDLAGIFQEFNSEGIYVNLPGVVPPAEWITEYLLAVRDPEGNLRPWYVGQSSGRSDFQKFEDWNEHLNLSKPIRLYIYLTQFGRGGGDITAIANVLLSTADFTENDIEFLFEYSTDLFGKALPSILHSARFAAQAEYPGVLDSYFKARSTERRDPRIDAEELAVVVGNPAIPTASLRKIASELSSEFGLAEAWSLEPVGELPQGEFDRRLREYREGVRIMGGTYLPSVVPQYAQLANRLQNHPNWDGEDFSFGLAGDNPWHRILPTLGLPSEAGTGNPFYGNDDPSYVGDGGWNYEDFYPDSSFTHLRAAANALLGNPKIATGNEFALYLPAVGVILREYRDNFDIEEGQVPHEWVTLLFT